MGVFRDEARWAGALAALVGIRVAIPIVALAASGRDLPALPPYEYRPLNGDSFGFYAAARELIASLARPGAARVAVLACALLVAAVVLASRWRADAARRWLWLAAGASAFGAAAAAVVTEMEEGGAAVIGWPLLWAVPMLPIRAVGALDADAAFAVGFPLQLVALAIGVVATGYIGRYATARAWVGLVAAALYAFWPLIARPLAGGAAWENGQWNVDAGLHLYTEPVSTALVATAMALLLRPRVSPLVLAGAGVLLSAAVAVRLTNGLFAAIALALVAWRYRAAAIAFAAGLVSLAPISLAFLPKGYPEIWEEQQGEPRWSASYFTRSWADSLIWHPRTLLLLAPLALLGFLGVRQRFARALLTAVIASNALLFSFYDVTYLHPRFLHVALPALFTLEAAGAVVVLSYVWVKTRGVRVRTP